MPPAVPVKPLWVHAIDECHRAGIDPNSLRGLRIRYTLGDPADCPSIIHRIANIEARMAELPASLSEEARAEIVEIEGQIELHQLRYSACPDLSGMRHRIAKLMEQANG